MPKQKRPESELAQFRANIERARAAFGPNVTTIWKEDYGLRPHTVWQWLNVEAPGYLTGKNRTGISQALLIGEDDLKDWLWSKPLNEIPKDPFLWIDLPKHKKSNPLAYRLLEDEPESFDQFLPVHLDRYFIRAKSGKTGEMSTDFAEQHRQRISLLIEIEDMMDIVSKSPTMPVPDLEYLHSTLKHITPRVERL